VAAPRVAIAGGGIGGLVLALGLRERGVAVEVHEQAGERREIGAAVALSANGVRELERLGLGPRLAEIGTEPSALSIRRWDDAGSIVRAEMGARYRAAFGAPYYGIHRAPLLELLADAVGSEHIVLGHRCVGVEQGPDRAELCFEGGDRAAAAEQVRERDARFADPYRDLAWIHGHDVRAVVPAH
jgi:salicylate hydroxylase